MHSPEHISQFRPISLCNMIYNVISKLLADCLKELLPEVVSPLQTAFVPGRLIMDNFLGARECFQTIKKNREGRYGTCAVKLDMHKVYDRVELKFIEAILLQLGFSQDWVSLNMECVPSVKYYVRLNSSLSNGTSSHRIFFFPLF